MYEHVRITKPTKINHMFAGGVMNCPCDYGYESKQEKPCKYECYSCTACWQRELSADKVALLALEKLL